MTDATAAFGAIAATLGSTLGTKLAAQPARRVHGGCINESYRWESASGPLFVKVSDAARLPMFEAEAAGLEELRQAAAVRVPAIQAVGIAADHAFLALEWIDLKGPSSAAQAMLGAQLVRQHQ